MKKIVTIILIINLWACSSSIQSVRVNQIYPGPETLELLPRPTKEDKKGKFITRVTQVGIIVLAFLTVNDYIK